MKYDCVLKETACNYFQSYVVNHKVVNVILWMNLADLKDYVPSKIASLVICTLGISILILSKYVVYIKL